ncbi:phosphorylase family protein [Sorangium sp. So ce1099]|uniref:phosphorylase family protein n=1 Tax=Sorangium sp. So ce1099 TaxID=3133331 RepID=UPI003F5EBB03
MPADILTGRVDALVVTALQDELEAVLALGEGGRDGWREARDPAGFPYYVRELPNDRGQPLRVAAAWSGRMGESAAAARAQGLIEELDPGCLAMCGICAGRRGEVSLGDVIVADRVYSYDEGKRVAPGGDGAGEFFHDIETYNLERTWNMDAALFAREFERQAPLARERPPSKTSQAWWLRHALYGSQVEGGPPPASLPERAARCPGWAERIGELEAQGVLRIGDGGLELTEAGVAQVRRDRVVHPDGPPPARPFRVHIGPIATGKAVQEDAGLFERLKPIGRRVLGVEMEAAAIGYVAERLGRRSIIAKAVSDHGDHDKDDSFRAFACRASAEFLFAFLRRYLSPDLAARAGRGRALRRFTARARGGHAEPHGDDILLPGEGRSDDFLSRVERVCRLREPEGVEIEWFDAPLPFGCYLRVSVNEGGIVRIAPLAALESGISTEAVSAFLESIDASYRRDDPGLVSMLVYGGEPAPEELVRYASARRVRLVRFLEYQGLIDFRGYLAWQSANLERDPTYPPALYALQGQRSNLMDLAFSPDGATLAAGLNDAVVRLWQVGTGEVVHELHGHANHVTSVAFSPDGATLATGSYDNTVRLWSTTTGAQLSVLRAHTGCVRSVAFSPDGTMLASGSVDRTIRLWQIPGKHGARLIEGRGDRVESVAFSPDGVRLASGESDGRVLLWNAQAGVLTDCLPGHSGLVTSVAFSPDGALLASSSYDTSVRLWDVATCEVVRVLRGHSGLVMSVAFWSGGATLVTSSTDGTLRLWDVRTGACLAVLLSLPDGWVAFRADGRYKLGGDVAGGFWHAANLCRFEPGELDALIPGLRIPDDEPLLPERPALRGD